VALTDLPLQERSVPAMKDALQDVIDYEQYDFFNFFFIFLAYIYLQ
jgi:hypothetical protein